MFSAVALVALSFAGMASTGEVETIVKNDCVELSFEVAELVQEILGVDLSPLEEGKLIIAIYDACEAGN